MGEAKLMEWRDTSSYSRDDKERIPKEWSLTLSPLLRITIHGHIHYPKGTWLFSCHKLGFTAEECGTDLEAAKARAIQRVSERVQQHAASLGIAPDPLKAELVEALKQLIDCFASDGVAIKDVNPDAIDEVRAALARAREGEKHGS